MINDEKIKLQLKSALEGLIKKYGTRSEKVWADRVFGKYSAEEIFGNFDVDNVLSTIGKVDSIFLEFTITSAAVGKFELTFEKNMEDVSELQRQIRVNFERILSGSKVQTVTETTRRAGVAALKVQDEQENIKLKILEKIIDELSKNLQPSPRQEGQYRELIKNQVFWMGIKIKNFQPDVIVINLGSCERKEIEDSFQSYPLYARELSQEKKVLVVNIDYAFAPIMHCQPNGNVNIFCLKGSFNYAEELINFLKMSGSCPIIFHSYHSGYQTCLSLNWVNELYENYNMLSRLTTIHGYFNTYANQILIDKSKHDNVIFEKIMLSEISETEELLAGSYLRDDTPPGWVRLHVKNDEFHLSVLEPYLKLEKPAVKPNEAALIFHVKKEISEAPGHQGQEERASTTGSVQKLIQQFEKISEMKRPGPKK